jgi:hypothetical protein
VRVGGDLESERPLQGDVLGGVVEVLLPPQDVGDAHERVVDDDGEVVGREAVLLADDEVVEFLVGEGDLAQHLVVDGDVGLGEPKRRTWGSDLRALEGGGVVVAPGPAVDEGLLLRLGGLAHRAEFLGRVEGGVGEARVDEPV